VTAHERTPARRTVRRGGITWHVETRGEGPPLLLLHGTGASANSFDGLAERLARHFRVAVPDLPGHARSEPDPEFQPSLPAMARAVEQLVAALGTEPRVIVGHSAGAAIALEAVRTGALAPRLVVGLAAALVPLAGIQRAVFKPAAKVLSRLPAATLARHAGTLRQVERALSTTGSRLDADAVERYRQLAATPKHVAGVLAMVSRWNLEPLYDNLTRVDVPVLLVAGGADRVVPLAQQRAVAARLPDARLAVIRGAGHLVHEERPAEVASLLVEEARHRHLLPR
jgi:magnesium chelatase accessory protein